MGPIAVRLEVVIQANCCAIKPLLCMGNNIRYEPNPMKRLENVNCVLYGYFTPPLMADILNLVLAYEKIYDLDGMLNPLRTQAKILASHFSGNRLVLDDVRDWDLADAFVMVFSVSEYYGFNIFEAADPKLARKILWLDHSRSTRKSDQKQFVELLDSCFSLLSRRAPKIGGKTIDTLSNLYMLFEKGVIVPRENFLPEIMRSRKATSDMVFEAA